MKLMKVMKIVIFEKKKMMPLTNEQKDCMIKRKSATLTKKVYISALLIKTTTKLRTIVVILINTE